VLRHDGDAYLLDHDFAFPERGGAIDAFSLVLTLDPAWSPPVDVSTPLRLTKAGMPPGTGAIVTLPLVYRGAGAPAAVAPPPRVLVRLPPLWLAPVALLLLAFATVRLRRYHAHEARNGRFAPLPDAASIDDAWLAANVFKYPPEQVGSLWDDVVGSAEVAAVLARLVQEGKLKSRIEKRGAWIFSRDVLYLEMPTPHPELNAYEDALVKALFVDGDSTDTERIRKHYEKLHKSFDPGAILKRYLRADERVSDENRAAITGGWKLSGVLALVALLAFGASVYTESSYGIGPEFVGVTAALGIASLVALLALISLGVELRGEVVKPRERLTALLVVFAVCVAVLLAIGWFASAYLGAPVLVLIAALGAWLFNLALNRALTRVSPARIALRKSLNAARGYFAAQLQRHDPRLQDAWYPYLIGFGLDKEMDHWFARHGSAPSAATSTSTFGGGSSPHGGGSPSGWSGGGGAFGGGGASGAWTTAATAMAAGVASASSSGGGGGGSSGGGGGGGW
jgi:uncharacterized membrane protein YgcG